MRDDIEQFVRRHGLDGSLVDALEAFLSTRTGSAGATLPTIDLSAGAQVEPPAVDRISERYEDLGLLGEGGFAEVRRVRDHQLNRSLAMKVLHADLLGTPAAVRRFLDEAQATAQLQHPNIVPVHDLGTLPDGRPWFTMKEIRGEALTAVLGRAHAEGSVGLHRLLEVFLAVCRAVAHAHERGVIHRDLKPQNVMVGPLGEVYVVDWGLAKVVGPRAEQTEAGGVSGTPAYMSPEQARGERVDERSDVYALGAVLYQILVGRPPYTGVSAAAVLKQVVAGPPVQPSEAHTAEELLPPALVSACERAMQRQAAERFASAGELARDVQDWLDGARRREQAMALLSTALRQAPRAEEARARAQALRVDGARLLDGIEPWAGEAAKVPGWTKQDQAERADREAELIALEVDQGIHAALRVAPDLQDAHVALIARTRDAHRRAEDAGDAGAAERAAVLLDGHVRALPLHHPERAACAVYLRGHGALTLVTDPPGARVRIAPYVSEHRRLVRGPERDLGTTPLERVELPMGSYLCTIEAPGRQAVRYPVHIRRLAHWDGTPPGASEPTPIWLPPEGWLQADEVYVPAGWFTAGLDPNGLLGLQHRALWCHSMVVQRFVVTNQQFADFLSDLCTRGEEATALRWVPRDRPTQPGELGAMFFDRDDQGRFVVPGGQRPHDWKPEYPATYVSWHAARAYLAWLAQRTGRPWRLPGRLEWQKMARGVDGRPFPFGHHWDPAWCNTRSSHPDGFPQPTPVDSFPLDVSPYGVRGVGGNVRDWCADREGVIADDRVVVPDFAEHWSASASGGTWLGKGVDNYEIDTNLILDRTLAHSSVGFRGVFGLDSEDG
ncbi:MAG: protein kinase [Myxococcales bacterium]|nr:protein kinase [Myxococcales bacterium]